MIVLAVIISLSVLILVHELGHFLSAKIFGVKVEEFGLGFPPRLFGRRFGETVYSVNLLPFGGFVKIHGEDETEAKDRESFAAQSVFRRSVMVLAGIFMNIVLGWFVLSLVLVAGAPAHLVVADVAADSPAQAAGVLSGDLVLEAKFGEKVLKDPVQSGEFVELVRGGRTEPVFLKLLREGEEFNAVMEGRENPPAGQGPLGVSLVDIGFPGEPVFSAFVKGFQKTIELLGLIVAGFWNFIVGIFVTPAVFESVAGPVGIFVLAAQAGAFGFVYLFELMAIISLNLAVLNLIPFPALDGGRFLFLLIEKIIRRPLPRRLLAYVNGLGLVLLLLLMVLVTVKDIGKLVN